MQKCEVSEHLLYRAFGHQVVFKSIPVPVPMSMCFYRYVLIFPTQVPKLNTRLEHSILLTL